MAFSTSDLLALEDAIKSGALRVRYQDRQVEYRTIEELMKAYNAIKAAVADPTTVNPGLNKTIGSRRVLSEFDKGL